MMNRIDDDGDDDDDGGNHDENNSAPQHAAGVQNSAKRPTLWFLTLLALESQCNSLLCDHNSGFKKLFAQVQLLHATSVCQMI